MRLGCLGCLGSLVASIAFAALVGGGLWACARVLDSPPLLPASAAPAGLDRKLSQFGLRNAGRAGPESIVLSEAEVSEAVSRHLDDAGLLISPLSTEMRPGRAIVQWRSPVGALLHGPPVGWIGSVLTPSMKESPLWITLSGVVRLQPAAGHGRPRYAEVTVTSARVGRLPVPGWLLILMAGPRGASLLRWPVPPAVDQIQLGDGRLTIRRR